LSTPDHDLAKLFWNICLFRRGPQDVPSTDALTAILLLLTAAIGTLIVYINYPMATALRAGVVDSASVWVTTAALLTLFRHPRRIRQTFCAIAGSGLVVSLLALPLIYWGNVTGEATPDAVAPGLLLTLLIFWNISINAHVYRHALGSDRLGGLAAALVIFAFNQFLGSLLLPSPQG